MQRTSATLLADSGGSMLQLQRVGGWKNTSVAAEHIEESLKYKKRKKLEKWY